MKKILLLILLFFIFSCSKNRNKEELVGHWKGHEDFSLKFYADSVVILNLCEKSVGTWKADSNTVYIRYPNTGNKYYKQFETFSYILNKGKDSLTYYKDKNEYNFLLKVKDDWKYYLLNLNLQIDLPSTTFPLIKKNPKLGIDIYVGYKDGSLTVKALRKFENAIYSPRSAVYLKLENIKKNERDFVYFNLIADKNIPKKQIDSIKKTLKSDSVLKILPKITIFRIYHKENSNYGSYDLYCKGELWDWYGRYE